MAELFSVLIKNPEVTLLIGVLCGIIGFLIYKLIKKDIKILSKELSSELKIIKELLSNHVTGTDKRIGSLENRLDRLDSKADKILELLHTKK